MRHLTLIGFFLLTTSLLNAQECDPVVAKLREQYLGFCNTYNQYRTPSYYPGFKRSIFEFGLARLRSSAPPHTMVSGYTGVPFNRNAVFCRMENHFLTRYSVKFSIHAGGYREVGSVR